MEQNTTYNWNGITAAFLTPLFLGLAPIFGKLAVQTGTDPFTVAALRTLVAVGLLWLIYLIFFRKYIYIYPAGLLGCIIIGVINGIGSLFYYGGLGTLDASLVQLINGMYLVFAVIITTIIGHRASRRTLIRIVLAVSALGLITGFGTEPINLTGIGLMLGSALMFAGTVILSQYVIFEMPAPTAALYILSTMAVLVTMVWLAVDTQYDTTVVSNAMPAIILLGITTALSRLFMFAGIKFLGGMQTAIFALLEIIVALFLAAILLGDALTGIQWIGVGILSVSILLVRQADLQPDNFNFNMLIVANMSSVQFQQIAFHRAFGTKEADNDEGTIGRLTTQEMQAIQRMMGASTGRIDPFPINKTLQPPDDLHPEDKTSG
ncbi:hypothetical protein MASR2M15_05590 [Anaerolineales bacterium]